MVAADAEGGLVASVGSLVLRAAPAGRSGRAAPARRDSLFGVEWVAVASARPRSGLGCGSSVARARLGGPTPRAKADWAVLSCTGTDGTPAVEVPGVEVRGVEVRGVGRAGVDVPGMVREWVGGVLGALQEWLADERLTGRRLIVLTRVQWM